MLEIFQLCSKLKRKKKRKRLSRQKTNVDTLAKATSDSVKIRWVICRTYLENGNELSQRSCWRWEISRMFSFSENLVLQVFIKEFARAQMFSVFVNLQWELQKLFFGGRFYFSSLGSVEREKRDRLKPFWFQRYRLTSCIILIRLLWLISVPYFPKTIEI